jgi:hypothetical protein
MKKKKSPPKQTAKPTHAELAAQLGCSRSLITKLYGRGYSTREIITRVNAQREKAEARAAQANRPSTERVNGHAANGHDPAEFPTVPVPPFAESERRKEFFLSEIRRAEAAKLHSQLFPIEPLRSILFAATHYLKTRLRDLPGELADELGPELTKTLRAKIHAVCDEAARVLNLECEHYGVEPPPPAPAPEVRERLSYYERFVKNSRTGEIETIPLDERIDSAEWRRLHPSVTFEQGFEILRKKREWDLRMSQLLVERSSWDLPNELGDEPPEPPPEPDAA